jgi:uncharacterized protein
MAVALPWLSLFALGLIWLWQGGYVWVWAIAAAVLGLLAWPLSISVQRRANEEARLALDDLAAPSSGWNSVERDAWAEVLAIADATAPFSFTEMEPLVTSARDIVEVVARRFHPEVRTAWAHFSLPEFLLLTERLSRDVRREALHHIPAVRAMRLFRPPARRQAAYSWRTPLGSSPYVFGLMPRACWCWRSAALP